MTADQVYGKNKYVRCKVCDQLTLQKDRICLMCKYQAKLRQREEDAL